MLQRLLTLPAQLTEEEEDDCGGGEVEAAHATSLDVADILDALAPGGVRGGRDGELRGVSALLTKRGEPPPQQQQQQAAVVEEEEEEKGRKVGN